MIGLRNLPRKCVRAIGGLGEMRFRGRRMRDEQ
jgi:hypothetical protein